MIKIAVIDDEQLIRRGIRKIIEMSGGDFEIVGEAADGEEGLKLLLQMSPDIAVVDVKMPKKIAVYPFNIHDGAGSYHMGHELQYIKEMGITD